MTGQAVRCAVGSRGGFGFPKCNGKGLRPEFFSVEFLSILLVAGVAVAMCRENSAFGKIRQHLANRFFQRRDVYVEGVPQDNWRDVVVAVAE